jgi:hypothetical protein
MSKSFHNTNSQNSMFSNYSDYLDDSDYLNDSTQKKSEYESEFNSQNFLSKKEQGVEVVEVEEEEEEEEEDEERPLFDNDNYHLDYINNFAKLTYRKKVRGWALFEFFSVFTYIFIAPHFWWITFTAIPSLYIFFIIPKNIDSYINHEIKYQIIYKFNLKIKNKTINYYHRWLLINAILRTIITGIITIYYQFNILSIQTFYLIQMILQPLINSYYAYYLEHQFNENILI